MSRTYEIIELSNGQAIKCLVCNRTSYSQGDVDNKWCHGCGKFHSELLAELRRSHPELTVLSRDFAHGIFMAMDDGLNEFDAVVFIEGYIRENHDAFQRVLDEMKPPTSVSFAKRILKIMS